LCKLTTDVNSCIEVYYILAIGIHFNLQKEEKKRQQRLDDLEKLTQGKSRGKTKAVSI
jgi:hypothetical protein